MSTPTTGDDLPVRRIDRILAMMSLGMLALSIACFIAIIAGSAAGADFREGVWPTVGVVVYVAPIIAFVLLLAVLIMTFVRRARIRKGR
jgi:FtsH-binding integral membrane protein